MDTHPTRVKPKLRGQLVGPGGPSDSRQACEQSGTSGLSQSVTGTIGWYGDHGRKFLTVILGKAPGCYFLA